MAAPVRAPLLFSAADDLPDPTSQALDALDPQGSSATGKRRPLRSATPRRRTGCRTTRVKGGRPAALAAAIAALRDKLLGGAAARTSSSPPKASPEFAAPAAAWAARSGDPVLFSGTDKLPKADRRRLSADPKSPVYVLGPSSAISSDVVREVAKIGKPVQRVSGEDPVANAIAFARYGERRLRLERQRPRPRLRPRPQRRAARRRRSRRRSRPPAPGDRCCSPTAPIRCRSLRDYLLDVKPGYTTDPTRAFYNHVWVIGDQEAIDVNQQAEVDELAELAKIGGGEE